jgi:hypothetical protein
VLATSAWLRSHLEEAPNGQGWNNQNKTDNNTGLCSIENNKYPLVHMDINKEFNS